MKITDPGPQYEYLSVEVDGKVLEVLKRNRAIRFSAFWATEPGMDEDKPDRRMTYSEIPHELWEILNEEERLTAALASAQRENARLKKSNKNMEQWLLVTGATIVSFVLVYLFA